MMAVQATGRVVRDKLGLELYISRLVPLPVAETWKWLSTPSRARKWAGTLTVVESVEFTRLSADVDGWRIGLAIVAVDGGTRVFFTQRVASARDAGAAGPVWEFRLDRLVAAVAATPKPVEADYATQQPYFERLAMDGDPQPWPAS